jgi:hypothetical protein
MTRRTKGRLEEIHAIIKLSNGSGMMVDNKNGSNWPGFVKGVAAMAGTRKTSPVKSAPRNRPSKPLYRIDPYPDYPHFR